MVWTDPRTGTEYFIQSKDRHQAESHWPATQYLVRNLHTGERASFSHESLEHIQESVTELIDEAEGLLAQRSGRRWTRALWKPGREVMGTVVEQARRLRWLARS